MKSCWPIIVGGYPKTLASAVEPILRIPPYLGPGVGVGTVLGLAVGTDVGPAAGGAAGAEVGTGLGATVGAHAAVTKPTLARLAMRRNSRRVKFWILIVPPLSFSF